MLVEIGEMEDVSLFLFEDPQIVFRLNGGFLHGEQPDKIV